MVRRKALIVGRLATILEAGSERTYYRGLLRFYCPEPIHAFQLKVNELEPDVVEAATRVDEFSTEFVVQEKVVEAEALAQSSYSTLFGAREPHGLFVQDYLCSF